MLRILFAAVVLWVLLLHSAYAERRVALIIGNSAYAESPLANPINDARDMRSKLLTMGFSTTDIVYRENLKTTEIGEVQREFREKIGAGGDTVALVFYAGHGVQSGGENYFPAVDAKLRSEEDLPQYSLRLVKLMELLEQAKARLNLVFLDACRNNPLPRKERTGARGLARVNAPSGTLITFATQPNAVADDGNGRNGVFTQHLLAHIATPGMEVEAMLKRVVRGVRQDTQERQSPWKEGAIDLDFFFVRPTGVPSISSPPIEPTIEPLGGSGAATASSAEEKAAGSVPLAIGEGGDMRTGNSSDPRHPKPHEEPKEPAVSGNGRSESRPPDVTRLAASLEKTYKDCTACPELIAIPDGEFLMGSGEHESEQPTRNVRIRSFLMGKTEVTTSQYLSCVSEGVCRPTGDGAQQAHSSSRKESNAPISAVSWNDAIRYCEWLSKKTGRKYRLPSEAEWEFAAKGGSDGNQTTTGTKTRLDELAWYKDNSGDQLAPTARKLPNNLGLYDMLGNAWEWVSDAWHENYVGAPGDGSARASVNRASKNSQESYRILRGGSFENSRKFVRTSVRFRQPANEAPNYAGFRVARDL